MSRNLHISEQEIQKQSRQIFQPVKYGESGVAMCYPKCKIDYNLSCFLKRPNILKNVLGKYYKRFLFITIRLEKGETENSFWDKVKESSQKEKILLKKNVNLITICKYILSQAKDPYFFLLDAHLVDHKVLNKILASLHQQIIASSRVGCIVFFESNISRDTINKVLEKNYKFLQNILLFPVYSLKESRIFLRNLASDWDIKISNSHVEQIVQKCGGSLWLLRESLRYVRDGAIRDLNKLEEKTGIRIRINTIYNLLSKEEKEDLAKIYYGNKKEVEEINKNYFLDTGLIEPKNSGYRIMIPMLKIPLKQLLSSQKLQIGVTGNIEYSGKTISSWFSNSELKILKLLIEKRGLLVKRDDIAVILWESEWTEKYSDWAIDKLMSRLRKVLTSLGLPRNFIKTKKGQGFLIS